MSAQQDDLAPRAPYGAGGVPQQVREVFPVQMTRRESPLLSTVPEPTDEQLAALENGEELDPAAVPLDPTESEPKADAPAEPIAEGKGKGASAKD